jgi:MinD-like ATPase involved in chromosome partitioning or flagellar assembly
VSVPVLTAVTGAAWEAALVTAIEREPHGLVVVRRCVDLADLLAVAAAGTARAVLLSADLRRLDRDALARLSGAGLAVVGLFTPDDEDAERRLRQLGLEHILPADASPEAISRAIGSAFAGGGAASTGWSDTRPPLGEPAGGLQVEDEEEEPAGGGHGRIVAVWGPTGAPGRTSVAVALASEAASLGVPALLVDADSYGGSVAQYLGMLDESPGLAAAVRLATGGSLDMASLAKTAPAVMTGLRVLSGISRADRWPELRPAGMEVVLTLARGLAGLTVVDCGFSLEEDEELSYDTAAPRRNGATLATLALADTVVAVGAADPIGVQRLVRSLTDLRELLPDVRPRVVLNKVRRSAVGAAPERQLAEALDRYAGVEPLAFVPYDLDAFDAALLQGRSLSEAAPSSAARQALRELAADLAGVPVEPRSRGRWATRRARGGRRTSSLAV